MNIQTVAENLRNTIAGKEKYLAALGNTRDMNSGAAMATEATRSMLEINIAELKRILQDVLQCQPVWNVHNCPYTETCHRID